MSDGIAWTPALRLQVHASRTQPNPAFLVERLSRRSLAYPLDPAACRAKAEEYWAMRHRNHRCMALLTTGLVNNEPRWQPVVAAAIARCEQPAVEIPLDLEVEAVSVVANLYPLFVAVPYWVTRGGVPFALAALLRCHELATYGKEHRYIDERGDWIVEDRKRSFYDPEDHLDDWMIVRALLAEASEADYAAARAVAAEALERTAGGPWTERAIQLLVPFAFPDVVAWNDRGKATALELAAAISKSKYSDRSAMTLSRYLSVAPIDTILEVCAYPKAGVAFDDQLTILAHRGRPDALRVLEANLGKWVSERHRKGWCKLLFALRSPEIVELVARRYPESKAVADAVAKYNKPEQSKKKKKKR